MIKLTEFTSVVDTYKKNFDIRSKRFASKKKKDTAEKIQKRENKIETKKFFNGLKGAAGNLANKIKPGGDILDTVIRFGVFTLLGLIVKNIDKVIIALKTIVEKLKEFAINAKKFFDEKVVPFLKEVYELAKNISKIFVDVADFVTDMNPFKDFDSIFNTVIYGILGLANKLGLENSPKLGAIKPPAAAAATKSETPVKTPAKTPANKSLVRTPAKPAVNIKTKTFTPTRYLTGAGVVKGVPSIFTERGEIPGSNLLRTNLEKTMAREYSLRELAKMADDKSFPPDVRAAASKIIRQRLELQIARAASPDELLQKQKIRGPYSPIEPGVNVGANTNMFAPTVPKPLPELTNLQKIQRGIKYLTKGLDFRFNLRDVLKIFKPENIRNVLKSGIYGFIIEGLGNFIGKLVSENTPFSEDNQICGYLGLVSQERVAALKAKQILSMSKKDRDRVLKKLSTDAESQPFFLDNVGKIKKTMSQFILDEYLKLTIEDVDTLASSKKRVNLNKKLIESTTSTPTPDPKKPPNIPHADDPFVFPDGTILKPGMTISKLNNTSDLDSPTTYGSQGVMISRDVVIAILPVEKEVKVPVPVA